MFYLKWNRGFPFPKWRENETSAFLEGFTKKFPVFRKQKEIPKPCTWGWARDRECACTRLLFYFPPPLTLTSTELLPSPLSYGLIDTSGHTLFTAGESDHNKEIYQYTSVCVCE